MASAVLALVDVIARAGARLSEHRSVVCRMGGIERVLRVNVQNVQNSPRREFDHIPRVIEPDRATIKPDVIVRT